MAASREPAGDELARRYGREPSPRRRLGIAILAVVAVALLGWLVWAALAHSSDRVGALVQSYDVVDPHRVTFALQVTRDGGDPVTCTVTAIASDHSDVGRRLVTLGAGRGGTHVLRSAVRTEREAVAVTVGHCH